MLDYENSLNPFYERKEAVLLLSQMASKIVVPNDKIEKIGEKFERRGLKSIDALHLACAEYADCDYFLTCDDRLIKKGNKLELHLKLVNPIDFVRNEEEKNGD